MKFEASDFTRGAKKFLAKRFLGERGGSLHFSPGQRINLKIAREVVSLIEEAREKFNLPPIKGN
jgi:hypothetical protein